MAYNLGITQVDPLRYDLLFERFLNPERISMPDIDIDFCQERRDEVIEYVREKYGKKNVAQIITFGTMASRGVIRDVARVLKIPISKADMIAKMIPSKGAKPLPLAKALKEVPELKEMAESDDPALKELFKYSRTLEGIARHASVHAAGIIITPDDITNYVPLYKNSEGEITTQWTMSWSEAIGLLKMDFLGLRNLTVIQKAEDMISRRLGKPFRVSEMPLDDEKTFKLFGDGLTVGVFQFESSGMQEYLKKLKPSRIEDLIAMNALYRPGPMQMIDDFIDRKFGRKKIKYPHPKLEPILKETYGIIVYQEQVMRIASELAGFSMAQADYMRKAMGKKIISVMSKQKKEFIAGCMKNGIDDKTANEIADLREKFAQYGFNKSHAVAYAIIAYQTAYLKAHFPAEFMAANLTTELNDSKRVMILMDECKKMGLNIKSPDVNHSEANFVPLDENTIAFGMAAIKNVGASAIQSIVQAREKYGKFKTIYDLLLHADLRLVNKKVLESLIQAGALDSLEGNRAQLFASVEMAIQFAQNQQSREQRFKNQRSIFELDSSGAEEKLVSYPPLPDIPDWSLMEKLKKERELLGYYISGHPLERYKTIIDYFTTQVDHLLDEGKTQPPSGVMSIAGQIVNLRKLIDSKGQQMAFVKIEDFYRHYEVVVFGSVFPKFEPFLKEDEIVFIQGKLNSSLDDNVIKIKGDYIWPIEKVPEELTESLMITILKDNFTEEQLYRLKMVLKSSPGKARVYFNVNLNGNGSYRLVSNSLKLKLTVNALNELNKIVAPEPIKIKVKEKR